MQRSSYFIVRSSEEVNFWKIIMKYAFMLIVTINFVWVYVDGMLGTKQALQSKKDVMA